MKKAGIVRSEITFADGRVMHLEGAPFDYYVPFGRGYPVIVVLYEGDVVLRDVISVRYTDTDGDSLSESLFAAPRPS